MNERALKMDSQRENGLEKKLLYHVGTIPKLMLGNHMRDDLASFVLHELCLNSGFGLGKAAYFINNPDFKCIKGIAGYHVPEAFNGASWEDSKAFAQHMEQAKFHNKVRSHQGTHLIKNSGELSLNELQDTFEFEKLGSHIWNLKHDNQGVFLFEKQDSNKIVEDHLVDFVQYLGFCPVY